MAQQESRKKLKLERYEWLKETKKNKPCVECGGTFDPVCMDYHHIEPHTKEKGGVRQLIKSGYSMEKIQAELDKCILLCANCHRLKHKEDDDLGGFVV